MRSARCRARSGVSDRIHWLSWPDTAEESDCCGTILPVLLLADELLETRELDEEDDTEDLEGNGGTPPLPVRRAGVGCCDARIIRARRNRFRFFERLSLL